MDNFDKIMALRSLFEHMGMPKEQGLEMMDVDTLNNLSVVKSYPVLRTFVEKMSMAFPDWDYTCFNQRMPLLTIDSYFYNESKEGQLAVQKGERSELELDELQIRTVNPDDEMIIYPHLLQLMRIHHYNVKNYSFLVDGAYLKLIIFSAEDSSEDEVIELGAGFNAYLDFYILNRYLDQPVQIPEGIELIYDLIFDIIGGYKIGLINTANPFFLIDELNKYMDLEDIKLIYESMENLIDYRHLLLKNSDNQDCQTLNAQIDAIQILLQRVLEQKRAHTRTFNK